MLFNSYEFMFVFLPLAWLVYRLCEQYFPSGKLGWLVLASLGFYAWWDIRFLPLFLGSILFNFWVGKAIQNANQAQFLSLSTWLLRLGVLANLALLGFFKYVNFFLENVSAVSGATYHPIDVVLPIGISFFTFQQIAYLVDVRRGIGDRYSLTGYTLFVSFFPQLIAGPIVHHREMMPQFSTVQSERALNASIGLSMFIAGLFKKVMIADNLAQFASPVFAAADAGSSIGSVEAWGASLAYTLQIYFDFSGYSDMALGLGFLFGIKLPFNFYSPYKSTSIIEFWRTWHMTLSAFLRDYLYIALGGNRKGPLRRYVNLFLTMLLGGFWHGAGWGFVVWGALHGFYLIVNHAVKQFTVPLFSNRFFAWLLTFAAVVFAWVFFRASTFSGALQMAGAMLGMDPSIAIEPVISAKRWLQDGIPLIVSTGLLALLLPNTNQIFLSQHPYYQHHFKNVLLEPRQLFQWRPSPAIALLVLSVFLVVLLVPSSPSEFLYFQF